MAGAVDITNGRECEVLADVEVLMAKEQEPFGDQVALHDHQRVLLCHLEEESARVRPWASKACLLFLWRAGGRGPSPTGHLELRADPCKNDRATAQSCTALHSLCGASTPNTSLVISSTQGHPHPTKACGRMFIAVLGILTFFLSLKLLHNCTTHSIVNSEECL